MAGQGSQTVPGDVAHTGGVGQTHLQLGQSVSHSHRAHCLLLFCVMRLYVLGVCQL